MSSAIRTVSSGDPPYSSEYRMPPRSMLVRKTEVSDSLRTFSAHRLFCSQKLLIRGASSELLSSTSTLLTGCSFIWGSPGMEVQNISSSPLVCSTAARAGISIAAEQHMHSVMSTFTAPLIATVNRDVYSGLSCGRYARHCALNRQGTDIATCAKAPEISRFKAPQHRFTTSANPSCSVPPVVSGKKYARFASLSATWKIVNRRNPNEEVVMIINGSRTVAVAGPVVISQASSWERNIVERAARSNTFVRFCLL